MKSLLMICVMNTILIVGFISCKDENPDWTKSSPTEFYHPTPITPTGIFDYTRLESHPRLLMNAEDFTALKSRISASSELQSIHDIIIDRCNSYLSAPTLKYELQYERLLSVSREALARIFHLAYGYRMTDDSRYLTKATEELTAICNFNDWHPSCMLDLAEMSTAVALGYDWLYHELSEEIKDLIEQKISYFTFYLADKNGAQYKEKTNYWNSVCNASRVLSALAIFEFNPTRCRDIIETSLTNNTQALAAYGPDGTYAEGYGAWGYGTTYEVLLLATLDNLFGTDNQLSATPGFLETAEYMLHMEGVGGKIYNYGDNHEAATMRLPMWYFAEKLNDPSLLWNEMRRLAEGDYAAENAEYRLLPMVMAFTSNFNAASITAPTRNIYVGRGTTPVVLIHSNWACDETDKFLAFKGGTPTTEMGHNDIGSFVYDAAGIRWSIDPCHIDFTTIEDRIPDYWENGANASRWDEKETTRPYHSTWGYSTGNAMNTSAAIGTIRRVIETPTERGATLDLSKCVNNGFSATDQTKFTRTITLREEKEVKIIDSLWFRNTGGNVTLVWRMVTEAEVTTVKNTATNDFTWILEQNGKKLYVRMQSTAPSGNQNFRANGNQAAPVYADGYTIFGAVYTKKSSLPYNVCTVTISETDPN